MQRITGDTVSENLFGTGKDGFTEGDPELNISPTVVTDDWLNSVQEELSNVIEGAGITLDVDTRTQLYSAILKIGAGRRHLSGLLTANNATDPTNDIDIGAGYCKDFSGVQMLINAATVTKRIDAAWAAGTGNGGFPSGGSLLTLTNSTWYRLFAIGKSTDKTAIDFGWDTSATAANLLHASNAGGSGFDLYRQIAWTRRGTATNVAYFQDGDIFTWDIASQDASAITGNTSGTGVTLLAPPSTYADFIASIAASGATRYMLLTEMRQTNSTPSSTLYTLQAASGGFSSGAQFRRLVDSSSQIRHRASSTSSTLDIFTRGWLDLRGKE